MHYVEMHQIITEGWKELMSINFKSIIDEVGLVLFDTDISLTKISVVLAFALLFGIYIFIVYKISVNNEFYSKDFNRSLILMSVITSSIVLAIQSNLVISLGMVGALSIVRFRTAIKSTLDLVFLYWSISVGIVCGASLFMIAALTSIVVTIAIFVSNKIESPISLGLLIVHTDNIGNIKQIDEEIKKSTTFLRLKNKTINNGKVELIYEYKTKDKDIDIKLSCIKEINSYSIMNYDRETRI